jgi:hypothetical protein
MRVHLSGSGSAECMGAAVSRMNCPSAATIAAVWGAVAEGVINPTLR